MSRILLTPQFVTVRVEGTADRVQKLGPQSIKAYVEIPQDFHDTSVNIQFEIPDGIAIVEHTPLNIRILDEDQID